MELVLRYLENAVRFRNMAAVEPDPRLRAEFERQAEAYRKMAENRAKERDLPMRDKSA